MTLLVAWLLAPLLYAVLAFGTGLLIERAAGYPLPGPLLAGVGFTGMVCLSQVLVRITPLAPVTPFAMLAVAIAGLVLARRRIRAPDRAAVVMGLLVFGLFAAPSVLTGEATFLGYSNEGDGSFHFILADRLVSHGYDLSDLPYSSYSATAQNYFATSYPTGAHTVLGSLHVLLATDVAWLLEPYLTVMTVTSALVLYSLVRPFTRGAAAAAFAAGLAVSGGLVYAYANNQQALKELAALACITTAVGVLVPLFAARPTWRAGIPLAIATAAGMGVLSLALAPWIGPLLLCAAVVTVVRHRRRWPVVGAEMVVFSVVAVLLALPTLTRLGTFVKVTNVSLTGGLEFGNLLRPLPFIQGFGVWPAEDFRLPLLPGNDAAMLLVGAVALAALVGLLQTLRLRAWPVLLFAVVSLIGFLAVAGRASPWAYAKALMLFSPVVLLLAGMAVAGLWAGRRRAEAGLLAVVLLIGVLWTDARGYHASSSAPHDRLSELAQIGADHAGKGPALYLEFEEFSKYFLRKADPSGPAEPFRLPADFAPGYGFNVAYSYDLDQLDANSLRKFNLLVVRRAPSASRPGTGWTLATRGRYYDVWERVPGAPDVLGRQPLGTPVDAASDPPCDQLRTVAEAAGRDGRLAYSERPTPSIFHVTTVARPAAWQPLPDNPELLDVKGPGRVSGSVDTRAGRFEVWVAGNLDRLATVTVDGRPVGAAGPDRNVRPSQYRVGTVTLDRGSHDVAVTIGSSTLRPGNGAIDQSLGQVTLVPLPDRAGVDYVSGRRWRTLCNRHLDWVEALR